MSPSRHSAIIVEGFCGLYLCGECKLFELSIFHPTMTLPRADNWFQVPTVDAVDMIFIKEQRCCSQQVPAQPSSSSSGQPVQETLWLELKDCKGRQPPHQFKAGLRKSGMRIHPLSCQDGALA